jgi:hypothetical protein
MLKTAPIVPYIPASNMAAFEEYGMRGIRTVNSIATGAAAKNAWFKEMEGNILEYSVAFGD